MKNMKKILALLVAVLMIAASVSAFAADTPATYTITINKDTTDKAAHTYGAYQVFTGKLETVDGKDVLSDIQWGSNIVGATLITELNKISGFSIAEDASASTVARAISDKNYTADSEGAQAIADAIAKAITGNAVQQGTIAANASSCKITGLAAGYYFVKDDADVNGEGAETRFILEVVKNVTVAEKASVPTVEKKVKEKNDSTNTTSDWQDAADYDIGDAIPYKITGTLPSKFAEFDTYKTYTFTDTLTNGLTPPAASAVSVKDGNGVDLVEKGLFTVNVTGQVITVSLASGKDLRASTDPAFTKDSTIVVTYSAVLNEHAKLGAAGNPNTVKLEFSNNPNYDGDGDTGTTPEDKVTVFTFKLVTNKKDEDGTTALKGAGFTLYKWDAAQSKYVAVGEEKKGEDMTTFEFTGEDSGQYKLVETTVPTGYNKADDLEFKVVATYGTEGNPPTLTDLKVTDLEGNELTTWTISSVTYDSAASEYAQGDVNITNRKGSVLPSTGGMGTTILYVVGSILVLAAIILLVTKRRMSSHE